MEEMEPKEKSEGLAKYVERRNGGNFEIITYSGIINTRGFTKTKTYAHVLIIPLPSDFNWSNLPINPEYYPDCILITEETERLKGNKRHGKSILLPFLKNPGSLSVQRISINGKFGKKSSVWINEEVFRKITKRDLYVDKFYAEQIFSRGKNSSNL